MHQVLFSSSVALAVYPEIHVIIYITTVTYFINVKK